MRQNREIGEISIGESRGIMTKMSKAGLAQWYRRNADTRPQSIEADPVASIVGIERESGAKLGCVAVKPAPLADVPINRHLGAPIADASVKAINKRNRITAVSENRWHFGRAQAHGMLGESREMLRISSNPSEAEWAVARINRTQCGRSGW